MGRITWGYAGWGRVGEPAAVPGEGGVLQDLGAPGPDPRAGTALRARALGGPDAARGGCGGDQPVATAGGTAPRRAGDLPQGRLDRVLLVDQPAGRRAPGRGPADPHRGSGRSGGTARGPANGRPDAAALTAVIGSSTVSSTRSLCRWPPINVHRPRSDARRWP